MGRIIEQEDEMHDQSVDQEDMGSEIQPTVAQTVEDEPQYIHKPLQIYNTHVPTAKTTAYLTQQRLTPKSKNLAFAQKKSALQMKQLTSSVEKFQNHADSMAHQNLRLLNSRAKTTLNLQKEVHQADESLA